MARPLSLALSCLALACTPVVDGADIEPPVAEAFDAPAQDPPRAAPESPRCTGPAPTEVHALDPDVGDEPRLKIKGEGDTWLGLPLKSLRYDTVVVGTLAETTVTQIFHNPLPDPLEAVYTFPLPADAAVDDYWIRVGTRSIRGLLRERAEAEKLYDEARAAGRTAALLTQERPNIFTQAVTRIGPGETVEIEIHFVQPLRQRAGRYSLALPTVVGPRYSPPGAVADDARITPPVLPAGTRACVPVDIDVAIETTLPVTDVAAKMHAVTVTPHDRGVHVTLADGPARADRDFELAWRLGGPEPRAELLAQEDGDGGYFALTIQPPQIVGDANARPRELVFVVDVSGSMRGIPLATARAAVERALAGMRPDDTFNVITFAGRAQSFAPQAVANTADNRERALAFLAGAGDLGGRTDMLTGVAAALDAPKDPARLRQVLFITDGYIGNEAQIFAAVKAKRRDARVYVLGVGSSVNRFLVDGLARVGRGSAVVMGPGERPDDVVAEFYESVDRPVLTDISIDWGELRVRDVTPAHLPDLHAGQPVVVYGRYRGRLGGEVRLRGQLSGASEPGGSATVELPVQLATARATAHDGIAGMWARTRIDELTNDPFLKRPGELTDKRRAAVVALALRHRILTAHTAFVAVEERRETGPDGELRTVHVPVEMPHGVTMGGGSGLPGDLGAGRGAGGGFGGRAVGVPAIGLPRPEVLGALPRQLVQGVVRAHLGEVYACYRAGLQQNSNLRGRLVLAFTVDRAGVVTAAEVVEDDLRDPRVGACIAESARRWRFPGGEGEIRIRYPFVLGPA